MQRPRLPVRLVVLTGAGVSAESGVPTFRGPQGLWRQHRPEDLATPAAFGRDPRLVWEWYDWRRQLVFRCRPNPAHLTLARMEQVLPEMTLITQNVDGLHQRAGSRNVLELHGSLWRARCTQEGTVTPLTDVPLPEVPPRCRHCGALLRPDVVWFGEPLDPRTLQAAMEAASRAEVMLVVGTSAVVYPAAQLPLLALENGAYLIEVNPEPTSLSPLAHERWSEPAGKALPRLWAMWQAAD
ncbi:MAG: NAD-dependent deacylase [Anaerolineae bacterium]|nr:NAD-dependent deacylase [Anaerolineae bacterium]